MLKTYLTVKNALENREEGQGLVEYGLIIGLVGVLLIAGLGLMQGALADVFSDITGALNAVEPG